MIYCNYYEAVEEDWGGCPDETGVGGVREEGQERAGGWSSKKSGKQGEAGEIAANYATIRKISQTTRAKSRLKGVNK